MRRMSAWITALIALMLAIGWFFTEAPVIRGPAQSNCPVPAVIGRQPYPNEMYPAYSKASSNTMGSSGPPLPQIYKGYPNYSKVDPYVPCTLMYAVAYTESAWYQYNVGSYGESGPTLISFDCGYGIMQITGGMINDSYGQRVAAEPAYNIGAGALSLIRKWNDVPNFIGLNDPKYLEDWYFATWAYNGYGWVNNPNNSDRFEPNRPPFDGTQPRWDYPYQELVWGYAAHPPVYNNQPLWPAVAISLPPRNLLTNPLPEQISQPQPAHTSSCYRQAPTPTPTRVPLPTRTPFPTVPGLEQKQYIPLIIDGFKDPE